MLASCLKNKRVCIIDANNDIGAKIKVSGGGKCNITNKNVSFKNYLGDENFLKPILQTLSPQEFLKFCKDNGLFPSFNEKIVKGTYFCQSSKDVLSMFKKLTTNTKYFLNTIVKDVSREENYFVIKTNKQPIEAKKVVIASGGISFPVLNASSIAYDIAKKFNHTITTTNPALVGFTVQKEQFWFKKLSGISAFVKTSVEGKSFEGNILFAHKGCSGPVILNSSLYWKKGKMSIDFLPNHDINKLLNSNKKISTALPLSKRFIQEFLSSIELENKAVSSLKNEEIEQLKKLKNYEFAPAGNFGFTKAEVTKGGISTSEIDEYTMQSKLQKDLFFLGECLDVTGELGGYNFHFAWASAKVCSKFLNMND